MKVPKLVHTSFSKPKCPIVMYNERYSIALLAQKFRTGLSGHRDNCLTIFLCRSNFLMSTKRALK